MPASSRISEPSFVMNGSTRSSLSMRMRRRYRAVAHLEQRQQRRLGLRGAVARRGPSAFATISAASVIAADQQVRQRRDLAARGRRRRPSRFGGRRSRGRGRSARRSRATPPSPARRGRRSARSRRRRRVRAGVEERPHAGHGTAPTGSSMPAICSPIDATSSCSSSSCTGAEAGLLVGEVVVEGAARDVRAGHDLLGAPPGVARSANRARATRISSARVAAPLDIQSVWYRHTTCMEVRR